MGIFRFKVGSAEPHLPRNENESCWHIGEHPNIVRLHEVYLEQPPFYLEEEYIEEKDLRTWCETQ